MTPTVSGPEMTPAPAVVYPESDGKPMADNTKQARWIVLLYANLKALFADRPDVFVACNLLWYPVKDDRDKSLAPDVMVVFGRPKGDRGSYVQCQEGDTPPTVVFEVLSPGNTRQEMDEKLVLYEQYGVEEYYLYDPERNTLDIRVRNNSVLRRVHKVETYASDYLGIRFEMTQPEMTVFRPDGRKFLELEEAEAEGLRQQRRADEEQRRADEEQRRADEEQRRGDKAEEHLKEANKRVRRFAELSRKARQGQATAEELAELDNLEAEAT